MKRKLILVGAVVQHVGEDLELVFLFHGGETFQSGHGGRVMFGKWGCERSSVQEQFHITHITVTVYEPKFCTRLTGSQGGAFGYRLGSERGLPINRVAGSNATRVHI